MDVCQLVAECPSNGLVYHREGRGVVVVGGGGARPEES